ncbi:MAG: hypothetical protein KDG55_01480 [Rhodocyclaceae bacterium]|nr:hypothetical protein [Rhodocyclaceae bacterium]
MKLRTRHLLALLAALHLTPASLAAPACVDVGGMGGTGAPLNEGGIGGTGAPAREGGLGGTGAPAREGGMGGTGAPASGIGGTGAPLAKSGVGGTGSPAGGLGGTGAPASGIGGTGAPIAGSGIGGTGAPVAGSGIGGTGAPASGIGGTGAPANGLGGTGSPLAVGGIGGTGSPAGEGGIGGTGIVGTITGFASICVNGVEVHFDADTPVDMNAQPATIANLAVGQVVAIRAQSGGRGLEARGISIVNAYEGPVTAIRGPDTIEVMGQTVQLAGDRRPAALAAGDRVRVSGLRAPGGELIASRVALAPELTDASVAGPIASPGTIGGVRVAGLGPETAAVVRGQWTGRSLQASEVRPDPVRATIDRGTRAIVEGIVLDRQASGVRLESISVSVPRGAVFTGGQATDLQRGDRIRIFGTRSDDNTLKAERVQFVRDLDGHGAARHERDQHGRTGRSSGSDGAAVGGTLERNASSSSGDDSDVRVEVRTESSDGSESRVETEIETESGRVSTKSFQRTETSETSERFESQVDASGETRERYERESRALDESGGMTSERVRDTVRGDRHERRERIERYDADGRRIDRIETRIREDDAGGAPFLDRRSERVDRVERVERLDEPERVERVERIEEPEKVERVERIEEPEKVERVERIEEPEKVERVERIEEPETVERVERIEEPEKVERVERIEEPETVERVERIEEPEKVERVEKIEAPEEIERVDRIDNSGKG